MRLHILRILILLFVFASFLVSQERPQISFKDLILSAELDHKNILDAREVSLSLGIPISVYLKDGIFIEAKGVENNKPVFAVIRNLLHPYKNGEVMFFEEVSATFNFDGARINFGNGLVTNQTLGFLTYNTQIENLNTDFLLITESTNNRVMLFDFATGDLINENFIFSQSNFALPKQAMQSPRSTISISDQSADVVFDYDTLGTFIGIFAPSIGPHTGILDNVRGLNYHPANNHLVVCNAQGGNFNRVVEFDVAGNLIGDFVGPNSGGLLGPFDIIFRTNDVLVTGSTSSAAHRYDLDGNYIDDFAENILFPQQMVQFPNGDIGIASFGSSGGLKIYDQNGNLLNDFTSVSGLRGVHYLGNGNILVTNSAGVHEINGNTGDFVRTIVAGVSAQYINSCDFNLDITPVELVSFTSSIQRTNITLNWTTASEINNIGFEIQRKEFSDWERIGFVEGKGTTTEENKYSFTDRNLTTGKYKYRLKQIDYDGSFEYSDIVEVEILAPIQFSLEQNYPNPFNPATTIQYSIPESGKVTLMVYNSLGEQVEILVDEIKEAGNYQINFDASYLSSGIYYYELNIYSLVETKKMVLMR